MHAPPPPAPKATPAPPPPTPAPAPAPTPKAALPETGGASAVSLFALGAGGLLLVGGGLVARRIIK
jgi:LPXTG-motif cell wall-anchored protein